MAITVSRLCCTGLMSLKYNNVIFQYTNYSTWRSQWGPHIEELWSLEACDSKFKLSRTKHRNKSYSKFIHLQDRLVVIVKCVKKWPEYEPTKCIKTGGIDCICNYSGPQRHMLCLYDYINLCNAYDAGLTFLTSPVFVLQNFVVCYCS